MSQITQPTETVRQVSGLDADGHSILAVLAKRTYVIERGTCRLAHEQIPLREEMQASEDDPDLLEYDTDLFPLKPATDVVVKGSAHARVLRERFEASVAVGSSTKSIAIFGKRHASLTSANRIVFSEPEPVVSVPLRYEFAYGGRDRWAESKYGLPAEKFRAFLPENLTPEMLTPYSYPRNPSGRGYLMEAAREAVDGLNLPLLEDPDDLLSPDRMLVHRPGRWPLMPLPQSVDWVNFSWFPRVGYFGVLPEFEPFDRPLPEIARGWAPADILEDKLLQDKFSLRLTNGASLGLQLPHITGAEVCRLTNMHPTDSSFTFSLPGERPRIFTDGRNGKLNQTEPVVHTVVIEPDVNRVTILWRGSAKALRPYMSQELESMPLSVEWQV